MKKIFTLLFCVVAMGFAAHAQDATSVNRCINALLIQDQPTLRATLADLDANQDGILSILDATMLIDRTLQVQQAQQAPVQQQSDIKGIVDEALETTTGRPDIEDVNKAIEKGLKKQQ